MENPGKFAAQKNGRLQSVIEHSDIQCDPKWRFRLNSVFDNFLLKHVHMDQLILCMWRMGSNVQLVGHAERNIAETNQLIGGESASSATPRSA